MRPARKHKTMSVVEIAHSQTLQAATKSPSAGLAGCLIISEKADWIAPRAPNCWKAPQRRYCEQRADILSITDPQVEWRWLTPITVHTDPTVAYVSLLKLDAPCSRTACRGPNMCKSAAQEHRKARNQSSCAGGTA